MAWSLEGNYFENCSCDTICPCAWSGLTASATHDRCLAMLAFHVDDGEVEGVDVSELTFGLVVDSPPVMADGDWKVGVSWTGARRLSRPKPSDGWSVASSADLRPC